MICNEKTLGAALTAAAALFAGCASDVTVLGTYDEGRGDEGRFVRADEAVPHRYVVLLDSPKDPTARARVDVPAVVEDLSARYAARSRQTWTSALHGFTAEMTEADARALAEDPG